MTTNAAKTIVYDDRSLLAQSWLGTVLLGAELCSCVRC
jgi:hypothetical protein